MMFPCNSVFIFSKRCVFIRIVCLHPLNPWIYPEVFLEDFSSLLLILFNMTPILITMGMIFLIFWAVAILFFKDSFLHSTAVTHSFHGPSDLIGIDRAECLPA